MLAQETRGMKWASTQGGTQQEGTQKELSPFHRPCLGMESDCKVHPRVSIHLSQDSEIPEKAAWSSGRAEGRRS